MQVGQFLKGTVTAASDLNEVITKSNAVFGDNAGEIEAWASTAATSLGQSKTQALGAAAQFGNMFKQLGIGGPQVATMSKQMVQLATDFASFHNADITEVLEAQQAAFRGEYDSVQKFVPTITAASVEQKALALGLAGSTKELTAQDKAIAVQALLLEGAGNAMGDFTRTSAGFANQQRIMSAQWENLKATIGDAFLPVAAQAAGFLTSKLIPAFQDFAEEAGPKVAAKLSSLITTLSVDVPQAVRAFAAAFKTGGDDITSSGLNGKMEEIGQKLREFFDLIDTHRDAFNAIIGGLTGLAGAIVAAKTAASGLSILSSSLSAIGALLPLLVTPVGLFALAVGGLAAAAVVAYEKLPLFRDAVNNVAKAFKEGGIGAAVEQAGTEFGRLWDVVQPKLGEFIGKLGTWIKDHATEVKDKFGTEWGPRLWDWIQETAIPFLLEKLPGIVDAIIGWVRDNEPKIAEVWSTVARAFSNWVTDVALPQLQQKLPVIMAALTQFAAENLPRWGDQLALLALDAIGRMTVAILAQVGRMVFEVPGQMVILGLAMIGGLTVGLFNAFNEKVVPFFTGLGGSILGLLGDAGSWLVDTGSSIIHGLWNGIQSALGTVINFFSNLANSVLNWLGSDPIGWLFDSGGNLIRGLYNGIQSFIGNVISFFANLPGNIIGWLGGTGDTLNGQGGDFIHGLYNGIQGAIGSVISFFASLPGNIIGWLGSTGGILVSQGADVIRGFISGIMSALGGIPGALGAIPGMVSGAVSGAGGWLYSTGQSIIQGLIDGIRGMAGSVVSAVRGVVDNAIAAVPGVGGILSKIPGLAAGGLVTRPTLAVIGEAGPEAVIPLSMFNQGVQFGQYPMLEMPAATVGASGGGSPTININAQTNANPQQISRELSWVLLTRGR